MGCELLKMYLIQKVLTFLTSLICVNLSSYPYTFSVVTQVYSGRAVYQEAHLPG